MQRLLLTQYHVTDAEAFYTGQDFWRVPDDPTKTVDVLQPPYYLTLTMPGQTQPPSRSRRRSYREGATSCPPSWR